MKYQKRHIARALRAQGIPFVAAQAAARKAVKHGLHSNEVMAVLRRHGVPASWIEYQHCEDCDPEGRIAGPQGLLHL